MEKKITVNFENNDFVTIEMTKDKIIFNITTTDYSLLYNSENLKVECSMDTINFDLTKSQINVNDMIIPYTTKHEQYEIILFLNKGEEKTILTFVKPK